MIDLRVITGKLLLFAFILLNSWVIGAPLVRALEIEIREKATVKGEVILLGDIAFFSPPEDPRVPDLAGLEMGSSPYPGQALALNSRYLISRLGLYITDEDIQVKVPEALLVSRTSQIVDSMEMKRIFRNHILRNAPWTSESISFETITTPSRLALPEGRLEWEIGEKHHNDYIGNVRLVVTFVVDGRPVRKASVSGKIRVRQEVLRAVRDLRPGDVVEREDLDLAHEEMTYIPKQTPKDIEEIVGKRVVRSIRANQLITAEMVEDPFLVQKGDRVLIKAESNRILITTLGKALEDGRRGDLVRVVNINSGKEIFATVKSPELVEVSF